MAGFSKYWIAAFLLSSSAAIVIIYAKFYIRGGCAPHLLLLSFIIVKNAHGRFIVSCYELQCLSFLCSVLYFPRLLIIKDRKESHLVVCAGCYSVLII